MNEVKSIKEKKTGDVTYAGIISARNWFGDRLYCVMYSMIMPDDFVVGKWSDFHDGIKSNIEGLETLAICRKLEHAELIYNSL